MWVEKMGSKSEGREQDGSTGRESREADSNTSLFSQVIGLRTIQANNVIIIEKDKNDKEKLDKRENEVEENQKRMRMDLREFLASGGSVTEIRASEVLIIRPPMIDGRWEIETAGIPERGSERLEKEGMWSSMRMTSRTVMQKAERILNHKDRGNPECSGRVSRCLVSSVNTQNFQCAPRALSASTNQARPGQIQHRRPVCAGRPECGRN